MSHEIPAAALSELQTRVDKFNRRGAKRGFVPLSLTTVREFEATRSNTEEGGVERRQTRRMLEIVISGEVPVLAGYTFLASVQHTIAGNIVRRAPVALEADFPQLKDYRETDAVCMHCNSQRARKDTFVLRAPAGNFVQIGRNCLAQYIGSADPEEALRLWALEDSLREAIEEGEKDDWERSGGRWKEFSLDYLEHACAAVRVEGFKPSQADGSTRSRVSFAMSQRPKPGVRGDAWGREWDALQPEAPDREKALAVVAWVAEQSAGTDFMHSLKVACAMGYVERTEGLLCAGVNAFDKAMGIEALKRARPPTLNEHFGEVGKRAVHTFTVTRKVGIDGDYGTRTIVGLQDAAGRVAVWFASGVPDFKIGDRVKGKATVKKHDQYQGTAQTAINRFDWEIVEEKEGVPA